MAYPKRVVAVSKPVTVTHGGTFTITGPFGTVCRRYKQYKLTAEGNLMIPDGGFATIRHGVSIDTCGRLVWLCREPGTLGDLQLIVDQGPVSDGEVVTAVLNLANEPYRVKRGDVLSYLVSLS